MSVGQVKCFAEVLPDTGLQTMVSILHEVCVAKLRPGMPHEHALGNAASVVVPLDSIVAPAIWRFRQPAAVMLLLPPAVQFGIQRGRFDMQ